MSSIDIYAIEKDYQSRKYTNVQLGAKHGITEAYVRKLAKNYCWNEGEPRKVMPPLPGKQVAEVIS